MPHIHEKIDFTVNGWIVYGRKTLLGLHKKLGIWLPAGGHVELHEDPNEALMREIREEAGFSADELDLVSAKPQELERGAFKSLYPPVYLNIHDITPTHRHVGMEYFLRAKHDRARRQVEEQDELRWFSAKELDDPSFSMPDNVRYYGKEAIRQIGW